MSSKEFVAEMKIRLVEERGRLENELGRFQPTGAVETASEDENASTTTQISDDLSLESELDHALKDIVSALKLIEKGTYGVCKYCKQPIDERRLRARPMSTSCIECKKTLTQEM